MTSMPVNQLSIELLASEFFKQSAGRWKSQRRYYTLKQDVEPQEVVSILSVQFLAQGSPELLELAQLHQLEDETALLCGSYVTWESNYTGKSRKPSVGSTVFGVKDNILYRDRGFATTEPVIATYSFTNPKTLCLRTEYDGSVFEEEIKLIGDNYRTRQTIISRAGEELTIGQYLEKRLA
jgi:CpeS-like protein